MVKSLSSKLKPQAQIWHIKVQAALLVLFIIISYWLIEFVFRAKGDLILILPSKGVEHFLNDLQVSDIFIFIYFFLENITHMAHVFILMMDGQKFNALFTSRKTAAHVVAPSPQVFSVAT